MHVHPRRIVSGPVPVLLKVLQGGIEDVAKGEGRHNSAEIQGEQVTRDQLKATRDVTRQSNHEVAAISRRDVTAGWHQDNGFLTPRDQEVLVGIAIRAWFRFAHSHSILKALLILRNSCGESSPRTSGS